MNPHYRNRTGLLMLLAVVALLPLSACAQDDTAAYTQETVMVMMPDSVGLKTDLYIPTDPGQYPAVLIRTPYGSRQERTIGRTLAPHGYVVVVQNVRGQAGSEGEFFPFVWEQQDGMATLDWILKQSWASGDVGLWGVSYHGYTAWTIASSGHPAIKALTYISGWSDLEEFMAHNGAFQLQAHLRWFYSYAAGQKAPPEDQWGPIFRTVPISQFFGGANEAMDDMTAERYPYGNVNFPVLHITGWYDYIYPNVLQTHDAIAAAHDNPPFQRLIIGPWAHNDMLNGVTEIAGVDFGEQVAMRMSDQAELALDFFDTHIKGKPTTRERKPTARVFFLGSNEWRELYEWPPKATSVAWHLDATAPANSLSGGGLLTMSPAGALDADTFTFDPQDPVPSWGGALSHFFPNSLGPRDQTEIEERPDVLVYTSPPLDETVTIAGPVTARLHVRTDAPDTDFTVKLVAVKDDGMALILTDWIARMSYVVPQQGGSMPLRADTTYSIDIAMPAIAYQFAQGERVRLEVSSSNFPKYDRNPNTGDDPFSATAFESALQTVLHTEEYPSQLILPVVSD